MTRARAETRDLEPVPAEVQFSELLERARWNRRVRRAARYWHLTPTQIKRLLFTDWLLEAGRIGKGDMKGTDDFERWMRGRRP